MKRVLVLALLCAFGLGAAAFAAPLSGSWKTSFEVNPSATDITLLFPSFSSVVSLNYTLGSWVFGSKSTFALAGFTAQSFTAVGTLGAFSFSSQMTFAPALVSVYTYTPVTTIQTDSTGVVQTPAKFCVNWKKLPTTYAPEFLTWKTTATVSIAGVTLEGLALLDRSHGITVENKNALFFYSGGTYTQTSSWTCDVYDPYSGMGWRFKIAGTFSGVTLTSYTYFNLQEYSMADYYGNILWETLYCPSVAKSGYFLIGAGDCVVGFSEEYLTLEGFGFGCTFDVGLKITCCGFESIVVVAKNITFGGWIDWTFAVTFSENSKSIALCASLIKPIIDCFTLEIGFGDTGYVTAIPPVISDITLLGFGFTYKFNGVTFTALTELDEASKLFSDACDYTYLNADTKLAFLIPFVGRKSPCPTLPCDPCPACPAGTLDYVYRSYTDGYFEAKCVADHRLRLWEKWLIDFTGDACCGGAIKASITTWFGTAETLGWYGYWYNLAADAATTSHLVTVYGDVALVPSVLDPFGAGWCDVGLTHSATHDHLVALAIYKADTSALGLFGWAKSDIAVSIGVGSNFTIDLGLGISQFGWGSLKFGFTFSF